MRGALAVAGRPRTVGELAAATGLAEEVARARAVAEPLCRRAGRGLWELGKVRASGRTVRRGRTADPAIEQEPAGGGERDRSGDYAGAEREA